MARINPIYLHNQGFEATLTGDFITGRDLLLQARASFVEDGLNIRVGHVDRDLARAYAGLGRAALRDESIESAFAIHWGEYTKTDNEDSVLVASELAATEHVRARVTIAHAVEQKKHYPVGVNSMWKEARNLLNAADSNQDYLEQVVAHGSLALATLGRSSDLHLAAELVKDPVVKKMEDPRRQKAVRTAGQILAARQIFVPVHLLPQVRNMVIGAVAGPYIVKG